MSDHETDLQPDIEDVLQEEGGGGMSVPVCITDQKQPLRTQALPRKAGATMTKTLTTTPQRVLRADARRARMRVVSTDATSAGAFRFATNAASAQDNSTMCLWPGAQPLVLEATTELWLSAVTGTFSVGIATELWAEGE